MCGSLRSSRWLAAALIVSVTGPCAVAQRHNKREERAQIYDMEQEWRQAQLTGNVPEMDHLLSDDFLGILASGEVVTKSQQLDRMRTRQLCINQFDIAENKIKISGNLAVVISLAKLEGTAGARPLTGFFRYTQVYQRQPGDGWKITNFEATRVPGNRGYGMNATPPTVGSAEPVSTAPSSPPASPAGSASPRPQS